jgi:Ca2+-binding RTX toxin-like protein
MKHLQKKHKKQQIALVVGAATILAISAGSIPTITMTAWAAFVPCQPAQPCTGTAEGDAIIRTEGADNISGLGCNDAVNARGGNDTITGVDGNDGLISADDADRMSGDPGNDIISGRW